MSNERDPEGLGSNTCGENRGIREQKGLLECKQVSGWHKSGHTLLLAYPVCPFFSLNSISSLFPGWEISALCACVRTEEQVPETGMASQVTAQLLERL